MARELITWCDRHADRDEAVQGLTRRLDVGHGVREVDLCDDCHRELTEDIEKLLITHGRGVEVDSGGERLHCPFCSRKLTSPTRLSKHVDDIHPDQAASFITAMVGLRSRREAPQEAAKPPVRGQSGEAPCDLCDKVFDGPRRSQALGVHKRVVHGVVGMSSGAMHLRRKKEEAGEG